MALHIQSIGFPRLGHQIADVKAGRLAPADRLHQFGHQQVGQERGVETARTQHNQIGMGDRLQGAGQGGGASRRAAQPHDRTGGIADLGFPFNAFPVFELRPEAHIRIGGWHHLTLHGQHPAAGRDRRFQVAGDGREGRKKEVAKTVTLQPTACLEAVLEQSGEQGLLPGQGCQAVADIARGLHPQLPAQHPTAAAVIGHRDYGREIAAVALQPTEQGGEPGAAADRHDIGAPVEAPLGKQGIHQQGVLFRRQGLLDRAKAAALAQPDQRRPNQQHQGAGDLAGQDPGDLAQQPLDAGEHPVDGLQIGPHRRTQQCHQQPQAGGQHPALDHQAWPQPAGRPAGAAYEVFLAQLAAADPARFRQRATVAPKFRCRNGGGQGAKRTLPQVAELR